MKNVFISILLCILFLTTNFNLAFAQPKIIEKPNIKIAIDGKIGNYFDAPIIVDGRTLLPLRELLINLGVENDNKHIIWDSREKSIEVHKDEIKIYLIIGDVNAKVNDIVTTIEVAPIIYKNKTYLPARFVAQSFGKKVNWDGTTNTISIVEQTDADKIQAIIEKADLVLKKSKYKVEMQQSASYNSGLSSNFNSIEKHQVDNVNKINYVYDKYTNSKGSERVDEMLVYNKTFYAKLAITNKWGKSELTDKSFDWYIDSWDNTLMDTYLEGISFDKFSIDRSSQQGKIIIQGKINNDVKHDELGERETNIKIIIDENTYQYQEIYVNAMQIADNTQTIEEHFVYSEYNGDFDVYIPEDLPK